MKKAKSIFGTMILTLLVSASVLALPGTKVIAVINKAEWCPVCKANGDRAMAALMQNNKDGAFQFVANDMTNDQTKKKSAEELKKYGLDQVIENYNGTGVVFFFDPKTNDLLGQISVSKTDHELAEAMVAATNEVK